MGGEGEGRHTAFPCVGQAHFTSGACSASSENLDSVSCFAIMASSALCIGHRPVSWPRCSTRCRAGKASSSSEDSEDACHGFALHEIHKRTMATTQVYVAILGHDPTELCRTPLAEIWHCHWVESPLFLDLLGLLPISCTCSGSVRSSALSRSNLIAPH